MRIAEHGRVRVVVAWSLALCVLLLARLASGIDSAMHFSGSPVDGPFQLLNALRRIEAGQRGGVHFQFFHGLGVPYLHYPLFRLFGGGLVGSELSRQIISIIAFPAVLIAFFRAFTRDWPRTLALSFLVYVIAIALPLGTVTTPMVSMLGVRSTLPTLLPVALYLPASSRGRMISVGLLIGAALVIGTEQGLAALMAFAVVRVVSALATPDQRARLREAGVTIAIAIATLLLLLLLIGGMSGVVGALRYNLQLVPGDQFWYFGAPASPFAYDWPSVFALMRQQPRIAVAIVGGVAAVVLYLRRLWREPEGEAGRRNAALAVLAIYALISCASILGLFYHTYVEPCLRALLLLGALELDRLASARATTSERTPRLRVGFLAAVAFVVMVFAVPSTVGAALATLPHVVRDHVVHHQPSTLEGIWPATLTEGQRIVDQHRGPDGSAPSIWSTYSGWIEARNGVLNPTPFDYTMHALGPANRAAYVEDFRRVKPALVQTVLPTFVMYEIWMEQTSWEFYEELLRNYRAIGGTAWSIYWDRLPLPNPPQTPVWSASVADGATEVELPVDDQFHGDTIVALLSVQLDYTVHNPLRALPFVGAMPRYFVSAERTMSRFPVTLDPYRQSARFPVIAVRGQKPLLQFRTYSLLPGARFDVQRVQVSRVPVNQNNIGWLSSLITEQQRRDPLGPGSDSTGRYRWR